MMASSGGKVRPRGGLTHNPPRNDEQTKKPNQSPWKRLSGIEEGPAFDRDWSNNVGFNSSWKKNVPRREHERGSRGGLFYNKPHMKTAGQALLNGGISKPSVFNRLGDQMADGRGRTGSRNHRGRGRIAQSGIARADHFPRIPGFKRLEELSEQEPSEIVLVVANTRNGYNELFGGSIQPHMIVVMIKVLAKICVVDFNENKATVLSMACNAKFLEKLSSYIATIPTDTNPQRKARVPDFFQDLLLFCETIMNLLPITACEHLGPTIMLVKVAIANAAAFQSVIFPKPLTNKLEELEIRLKSLLDEHGQSTHKVSSRNETLKYRPPPNDYRSMSIFPLPEDILTKKKAFVRPNIIEGAYNDVDHYLDVQFRLLREDFVWPLRDGITDYLQQLEHSQESVKKINNIRIYENVRFLNSVLEKNRVGFTVTFKTKGTGFVNWEHSKRFMFGSLLCFTSDNFEHVLFGTVMDRKLDDLRRGKVTVNLSYESEMNELFSSTFIMVESEVYFEPYYHVLKALQLMKRDVFPMSQYIVDVQSEAHPPKYVLDKPNYPYQIQEFQVPVLNELAWPTAENLSLDDSQYHAFKSALTKEFVVIQGPPGTGKTYLGLKIATVIINNIKNLLNYSNTLPDPATRELGNEEMEHNRLEEDMPLHNLLNRTEASRHTPLLVVCFTNHALDQFLEGLLPTTKNIVRIGGQSRNPAMKDYNLKELRYLNKRSNNMHWLTKDMQQRMSDLIANIKGIQVAIEELEKNNGIVSVTCIEKVNRKAVLNCFMDNNDQLSDDLLIQWLVGDDDMLNLNRYQGGNSGKLNALPRIPVESTPTPLPTDNDLEEDYRAGELDDFGLEELPKSLKLTFALHILEADKNLIHLRSEIKELASKRDYESRLKSWSLESEYEQLDWKSKSAYHWLKNKPKIDEALAHSVMTEQVDLLSLEPVQRWSVYSFWVSRILASLLEELRRTEERLRAETRQFEETRHMADLKLIQYADIVGMTTTGAARLQPLLQALKSRIVIVEEAAEVMESHIIVSLTNHCQHIILIGDHQQLRPTTAVYRLARDFHFDISLFERMLKNGLHCEVLKVQHRMRPEISKLIVPSIYKELMDHESVLHFKHVQGVAKSLFFITHKNPEQEVGETHSRSNKHEADFLLSLCRYLLMQGYAADRITILTTYSGQMFYLRNERKKSPLLESVQMTIVDNFQGEENDIILLSLVRNNEENNIGFLKIENRVCVALSRAKVGFYIMGNMDNLINSSSIWPCIKEQLDLQQAVGESLMLYCPVHQDQSTEVRTAADFSRVPEGGCLLPCAATLLCGHVCKNLCHARDRDHTLYKCRDPCERVPQNCILLHPCPKMCFELCGDCCTVVERELPCGHKKLLLCYVDHLTYKCLEKVSVTDADCGHTFEKFCHMEKGEYHCPHPCNVRLDCGHSCSLTCHTDYDPDHIEYKCLKTCTKKNAGCTQDHTCTRICSEECGRCSVPVLKTPPGCKHVHNVFCSMEPENIMCRKPCTKTLDCGHRCRLNCFEPCGHCNYKVEKIVDECNHKTKISCYKVAQREDCPAKCERKMACGHDCKGLCREPCDSGTCEELVTSSIKPACGHDIKVPCGLLTKEVIGLEKDSSKLLSYCKEPCKTQLKCGHICVGTCGSCMQGRIHQSCRAKCGKNLICGHRCSEPCSEICPPCLKKCPFRCQHSRCNKKCGYPCSFCQEPCDWKCIHTKCTNRCGQLCNREPCKMPCKKRLRCKHPCIGYCGEPCPKLCRICNKEEVTTIVFGNEDDPNSRFVYLVDCKHTIESQALDTWLNQRRNEVVMPQCPLCKTDIMTTMRCMNQVKQVLNDVLRIKRKIYGEVRAINAGRMQLQRKLSDIWNPNMRRFQAQPRRSRGRFPYRTPPPVQVSTVVTSGLTTVGELLHKNLTEQAYDVVESRRNDISFVDLQSLTSKINFFSEIQKAYKEVHGNLSGASLQTFKERTDILLSVLLKLGRVNQQEAEDLNLELQRFRGIAQFCQLETYMTAVSNKTEATEHYNAARKIAFSVGRYSDDEDRSLIDSLKKLNVIVNAGMQVSAQERREIAKAVIGLKQGAWFKCPNGHFYAIGDCGGATQTSKCFECGAVIGGEQHRLLPSNHFAPEIDGASTTAWPGGAMNH